MTDLPSPILALAWNWQAQLDELRDSVIPLKDDRGFVYAHGPETLGVWLNHRGSSWIRRWTAKFGAPTVAQEGDDEAIILWSFDDPDTQSILKWLGARRTRKLAGAAKQKHAKKAGQTPRENRKPPIIRGVFRNPGARNGDQPGPEVGRASAARKIGQKQPANDEYNAAVLRIADRLYPTRVKRGLSQLGASQKAGVTQQQWCAVEGGKSYPSTLAELEPYLTWLDRGQEWRQRLPGEFIHVRI